MFCLGSWYCQVGSIKLHRQSTCLGSSVSLRKSFVSLCLLALMIKYKNWRECSHRLAVGIRTLYGCLRCLSRTPISHVEVPEFDTQVISWLQLPANTDPRRQLWWFRKLGFFQPSEKRDWGHRIWPCPGLLQVLREYFSLSLLLFVSFSVSDK